MTNEKSFKCQVCLFVGEPLFVFSVYRADSISKIRGYPPNPPSPQGLKDNVLCCHVSAWLERRIDENRRKHGYKIVT